MYNYCDRWCERCTRKSQCVLNAQLRGDYVEPEPEPRDVPDWLMEAFNREPTPEEAAEYKRQDDERRALTDVHPAVQLARRYLTQVRELARADGDEPVTDPVLNLAWESIQMLSLSISSKTARAIHEVVDRSLGQDWDDRTLDPRGVMTDGNGSAKVTLLMITESRDAWMSVARSGRDSERRAAKAIALLNALDDELRAAFPYAMEFVRPGFDE